jgi:hypothetical protein
LMISIQNIWYFLKYIAYQIKSVIIVSLF